MYNSDGGKVSSLVMTCYFIEPKISSEPQRIYLDNYFTGHCSGQSICHIWDDLLRNQDVFKPFTTIYLSGDTGSGFRSSAVLAFYSSLYHQYGITVEVHSLCPRHAYNLCDSHGAHTKRAVRSAMLSGISVISPTDFSFVINTSQVNNTLVYDYGAIKNKSPDVRDVTAKTINSHIAFGFAYMDEASRLTRTTGVVLGYASSNDLATKRPGTVYVNPFIL
jgi:hypothetical protein